MYKHFFLPHVSYKLYPVSCSHFQLTHFMHACVSDAGGPWCPKHVPRPCSHGGGGLMHDNSYALKVKGIPVGGGGKENHEILC